MKGHGEPEVPSVDSNDQEGLTHHDRSCHQQRASMAELPELPPVVLVAIKLPILLIVPVGEGILAF